MWSSSLQPFRYKYYSSYNNEEMSDNEDDKNNDNDNDNGCEI